MATKPRGSGIPFVLCVFILVAIYACLPDHGPKSLVAFGDSLTCDLCNDGSYIRKLDEFLPEPLRWVEDQGVTTETSVEISERFSAWLLDDSNHADILVLIAGTVDVYQTPGGFRDREYDQEETVTAIHEMAMTARLNGMRVIVVTPPPVIEPCDNPKGLTCGVINQRLMNLSGALEAQVDLFTRFRAEADLEALFLAYGLHPKIDTGDEIIAEAIAEVLQ